MEEELERTGKDEDVEQKWENIRGSVLKAADLLGDTKKHSNAEWFDEECRRAIGDKDEARSRCLQRETRSNRNEYCVKKKEATKIYRKKKREYLMEKVREIEMSNNPGTQKVLPKSKAKH